MKHLKFWGSAILVFIGMCFATKEFIIACLAVPVWKVWIGSILFFLIWVAVGYVFFQLLQIYRSGLM